MGLFGSLRRRNGVRMHYLNNAGAALMSPQAIQAIVGHLDDELKFGPYGAAQAAKDRLEAGYFAAAQVLGVSSDTISMHDSASRAWNMALYGSGLPKGSEIVTLSSEFGTNLVSIFHYARTIGAKVSVVPCAQDGSFSLDEVDARLAGGAALIAISHAAAHGSIVNPVEEIGTLVAQYGTKYLVDGCQAAGQLPVDVSRLNCDAYTASGRKWLRGPRGTAFMHTRKDSGFSTPQVDLASADLILGPDLGVEGVEVRQDGKQFELWERSVAGFLGLGVALSQFLAQDADDISRTLSGKGNQLRTAVSANPHLTLLGSIESASGIVGFVVSDPGREDSMRAALASKEIVFSTMADWDCPLHFPRTGAEVIFRLSPHYYTSEETVALAERAILDFA